MLHQRADHPATLTGVEASRAFFASCLQGSGRESLWVAHVDRQARCLHLASHGGDRHAELPVGAILRDAALFGSAGLILAHQGPSGDVEHAHDAVTTRELAGAAAALEVIVIDHLVFTATDCTSMRRKGLL
jgi:DNA repair protein RadC